MLEAILTIVLLGLVFATIPMLLTKATESDAASLEGEALYHASALVSRIAALPFNSALLDGNESRIINLGDCAVTLGGAAVRAGTQTLAPAKFRSCVGIAADLVAYNPNLRAINQFHQHPQIATDRGFALDVTVGYLPENATWDGWATAAGPTNLLLITVTARDDVNATIGVLRYVATNIGASQ